jgi:NAD(P)-dependent dehydrogenase (short-subunit alcohol dehydrogenase family)
VGDLDGRVAWVTGAGSGIGAGVARRLARDGASVGVVDVDGERAADVADEIARLGAPAFASACDVADVESVTQAAEALTGALGAADVLVNCAGIGLGAQPVATHDEAQWQRVLAVNLSGAFHVTRAVLGGMIDRRFGRVVNISSGNAVRPSAGASAYASSKGGLIAFTKAVALEGAEYGVTANVVAPGLVDTAMTRRLMPTDEALAYAARESRIANPMGAVLRPDDVAHAVAFFCSPASALITGQTLHVNAGAIMP